MIMNIQAVIFDLDNTLTHRDQSIVRYAQNFLQYYSSCLVEQVTSSVSLLEQTINIIRRIDQVGYPKKEFFNSSEYCRIRWLCTHSRITLVKNTSS